MAKTIKHKSITKEIEPTPTQLIVQELNIMSADRSRKDIKDIRNSLQAAESVHYPNRNRLYDLYNDALLDGHLAGIIEKRIEAVLNKNLYFEDVSGKRVKVMDEVIDSKVFREIVTKILESQAWGISGLEFIPGHEVKFHELPRKHIKPHKKIIAFEQNGEDGLSYDGVSNIWVVGKDNDLGYLLKCSFYAVYKRGVLGDYAQYIEIFGQPVRVIYYDANDAKTKSELRKVLEESGSSLAMMIPKQAQFDMKDGKQSNANGDLQLKALQYCGEEMSIIVLGNTETTKSSKSSGYAQSKVHGKQQIEKTKSDMKFVQGELNSKNFIAILKSYGLPVEGGKFKFDKEVNIEELKSRIEIDKEVANQGVPIDDDYWYETYGIPKPKNYNELKAEKLYDRRKDADRRNGRINNLASERLPGLSVSDINRRLNDLYKGCCTELSATTKHAVPQMFMSMLSFNSKYKPVHQLPSLSAIDDTIQEMLRVIYALQGTDGSINQAVTKYFADQLWKAVTGNYGKEVSSADYDTPDYNMLQSLKKSVWQFASAKNYQQLRELSDALVDVDGQLRTFEQFSEAAKAINEKFMKTWLRAEYNLAVSGSQMAGKWIDIERNARSLPYLKFDAVIDHQTTELCSGLNDTLLPIGHEFWNRFYPPNHFGCRSTVRQVASGTVTPESKIPSVEIPKMFQTNLAKQGLIFPEDHPYFVGIPEDVRNQYRG